MDSQNINASHPKYQILEAALYDTDLPHETHTEANKLSILSILKMLDRQSISQDDPLYEFYEKQLQGKQSDKHDEISFAIARHALRTMQHNCVSPHHPDYQSALYEMYESLQNIERKKALQTMQQEMENTFEEVDEKTGVPVAEGKKEKMKAYIKSLIQNHNSTVLN